MPELLLAAALAVGYTLGRLQPYDRLAEWVNWQLRFHLDRWTSRPRQVVLFALLLATDPINTVRVWRHRNDPPPGRAPAPVVHPTDPDGDA